jgi:8-oxo-dGTP pyrophosphatase MutT (NUDIX family)
VSIAERIAAAHRFDATRFVPFVAGHVSLGFVRRDFLRHLDESRDVLDVSASAVGLRASLASYEARSDAMAAVAAALAARGVLSKWRGELYEIGAADAREPSFCIERAAVRFFGFTAQAVHVNGLTRIGGESRMWIAQRSPDKPIDPGMYDNLVGGGIGRGLSVVQTLVKEAWEEAGIAAPLAREAKSAGTLEVCREVPDGLHAEIIHIYDLTLPPAFEPRNQDGEVAGFRALTLTDAGEELAGDAPYTIDAALVAIDCLSRRLPGFGSRISSPG